MPHAQEEIAAAMAKLKEAKLRITEPRKALLEALAQASKPRSAEELHEQLGSDNFDLVTVYRNVEAFDRAGILCRIPTESGKALYELSVCDNHHHHHIICRKCHRSEKLEQCAAVELEKTAVSLGYTQVTHVLEVYGVCSTCR